MLRMSRGPIHPPLLGGVLGSLIVKILTFVPLFAFFFMKFLMSHRLIVNIGALETRRNLDPINFCKDFRDCYQGQDAPPVKIPEKNAGLISSAVPFSFLMWRN